jgi:hypothetical protein
MSKCICEGNWRLIVAETEHLLGTTFINIDKPNEIYTLFGIVHGEDDFYYGMSRNADKAVRLVSCCMNLKVAGWRMYNEWDDVDTYGV